MRQFPDSLAFFVSYRPPELGQLLGRLSFIQVNNLRHRFRVVAHLEFKQPAIKSRQRCMPGSFTRHRRLHTGELPENISPPSGGEVPIEDRVGAFDVRAALGKTDLRVGTRVAGVDCDEPALLGRGAGGFADTGQKSWVKAKKDAKTDDSQGFESLPGIGSV